MQVLPARPNIVQLSYENFDKINPELNFVLILLEIKQIYKKRKYLN